MEVQSQPSPAEVESDEGGSPQRAASGGQAGIQHRGRGGGFQSSPLPAPGHGDGDEPMDVEIEAEPAGKPEEGEGPQQRGAPAGNGGSLQRDAPRLQSPGGGGAGRATTGGGGGRGGETPDRRRQAGDGAEGPRGASPGLAMPSAGMQVEVFLEADKLWCARLRPARCPAPFSPPPPPGSGRRPQPPVGPRREA